jgi:hypothetical protein
MSNVAFALGGLGGNNAHGAGFLHAAIEAQVKPRMISCTSGQIHWVYKYLLATEGHGNLEDCLAEYVAETEPFPLRDWNLAKMALQGKPGMLRLASYEFALDVAQNTFRAFEHLARAWPRPFVMEELVNVFPARTMVPLFPDNFFEDISDKFNETKIGIIFNSYDPNEGIEFVHLNGVARKLLDRKAGDKCTYLRDRTIFKDITPRYVRDGLWLYEYGFEAQAILDGCYYRPVILSELAKVAKKIYVCRPINAKWVGRLPTSFASREDMKTEIAFNGSYQGERDKILLINKLIDGNMLVSDNRYHRVDLVEIEMETQEGYLDYISEDVRIFERAKRIALKKLDAGHLAV